MNISNIENIENTDNICLGIDFGTTNSCLSIWHNNNHIIITDYDGSNIIPTVIEINNQTKIIGKEAYLRKSIFEKTNTDTNNINIFLVYEIKKLLGKKYSELNKNNIDILAYTLIADENDNIKIYDENSQKYYFPEEIAIQLFLSFKLRSEIFLSQKFNKQINIKNTIISVPAYFNKNQREIIKTCAELANFNVLRMINEPTAAALCYGIGKNSTETKNILVYDLGGGTLDISLLTISDGVYEVLGSCGNSNLGGSDFDKCIMEYCITEFINNKNIENININEFIKNIKEESLQKLKFLCEQAKITLTLNLFAMIKINNFYNNKDLLIKLSREKFNEICSDLINIAIRPIDEVLSFCELEKKDVDEIIMVGGMTRIPIIRYNVERYFNKEVNTSIDPDNVVSIGASIHGYMILNNCNINDKLLLIDRTSLSVGVETSGGIMDVIIPRGTIIPIKKTRKYTTDTDYVDMIDIKIYEGERKLTKDNFLIGEFKLTGIEKEKRGIPEILITFEIDSNGINKIKAEDLNNSLNKKIIQISTNNRNLSKEELDKIIEESKIMDDIDRIDKYKKISYLTLLDNCIRILENINNNELKVDNESKENITENIKEIQKWLESTNYINIETDKYKELLNDFKLNYSIFLIFSNSEIKNIDSANNDDTKGIELLDDELDNKKYLQDIKFIRKMIDEYDLYKKHIKIYENKNKENKEMIDKINISFMNVYNLANELLLKFFIETDINDTFVKDSINEINTLDNEFKMIYNILYTEHNLLLTVTNKLNESENKYLDLLDKLNENSEENNEKIKLINNILELIIEYDSTLYKMNNGYIEINEEKLQQILDELNKF
jgi:heat shock protein 1/8